MVDASERLQVLLTQEATFYKTSDYLSRMQSGKPIGPDSIHASGEDSASSPGSPNKKRKSLSSISEETVKDPSPPGNSSVDGSSNSHINKHWREKICEWAYQVVDHFDLHREVVSIAMSHLDRYLAAFPSPVDKNFFQLLAMTCLYLSIKLNEYKHLLIPGSRSSMETILQLSRGFFTLDQMEKMEYDLLQRLQWHVHPPTPQLFTKHFLFFLSIEEHEVHDLSQFMVELSVMDYFFVSYKPSEIAIASVLNAIERLFPESDSRLHFAFHRTMVDINTPQVQACRERLSLIFSQANDQASFENMDQTPCNNRTTSPVSVMSMPQHEVYKYQADTMDTEYSDDEDL